MSMYDAPMECVPDDCETIKDLESQLAQKDKQIEAMKNCVNCGREYDNNKGSPCYTCGEGYLNWIPKEIEKEDE